MQVYFLKMYFNINVKFILNLANESLNEKDLTTQKPVMIVRSIRELARVCHRVVLGWLIPREEGAERCATKVFNTSILRQTPLGFSLEHMLISLH